jgi:phospholipid/cholesterol/gamma-HCH transport system ATP-binding protein
MSNSPLIRVENLTMAYGDFVVMRDLNFEVNRGEVMVIMGGSGCGKSTLLRHLIGLKEPAKGSIYYEDINYTRAGPDERNAMNRRFGVTFQQGALWSSMTLEENVAFTLEEYTKLSSKEIKPLIRSKLALVGLRGFEDYYPAEISGGMRKRAGLARAIALDPDILFFDEPSAGLDPLSSKRLDELIMELRDSLGATIVIVTHELQSIFDISDRAIFLDTELRTISALGNPKELLKDPPNENVYRFLSRDSAKPVPENDG